MLDSALAASLGQPSDASANGADSSSIISSASPASTSRGRLWVPLRIYLPLRFVFLAFLIVPYRLRACVSHARRFVFLPFALYFARHTCSARLSFCARVSALIFALEQPVTVILVFWMICLPFCAVIVVGITRLLPQRLPPGAARIECGTQ